MKRLFLSFSERTSFYGKVEFHLFTYLYVIAIVLMHKRLKLDFTVRAIIKVAMNIVRGFIYIYIYLSKK